MKALLASGSDPTIPLTSYPCQDKTEVSSSSLDDEITMASSRQVMAIILQVNEKSFDLKEGIQGWYKKEGDKTGMNGCMLPW